MRNVRPWQPLARQLQTTTTAVFPYPAATVKVRWLSTVTAPFTENCKIDPHNASHEVIVPTATGYASRQSATQSLGQAAPYPIDEEIGVAPVSPTLTVRPEPSTPCALNSGPKQDEEGVTSTIGVVDKTPAAVDAPTSASSKKGKKPWKIMLLVKEYGVPFAIWYTLVEIILWVAMMAILQYKLLAGVDATTLFRLCGVPFDFDKANYKVWRFEISARLMANLGAAELVLTPITPATVAFCVVTLPWFKTVTTPLALCYGRLKVMRAGGKAAASV